MQMPKEKDRKKIRRFDMAVTIVFVLALLIIYFFWGCHLDWYVTILACIIIAVSVLTEHVQNKKIKELTGEEPEEVEQVC